MIILLLRLLQQSATYAMFFEISSGWQLRQRTNLRKPDSSP